MSLGIRPALMVAKAGEMNSTRCQEILHQLNLRPGRPFFVWNFNGTFSLLRRAGWEDYGHTNSCTKKSTREDISPWCPHTGKNKRRISGTIKDRSLRGAQMVRRLMFKSRFVAFSKPRVSCVHKHCLRRKIESISCKLSSPDAGNKAVCVGHSASPTLASWFCSNDCEACWDREKR